MFKYVKAVLIIVLLLLGASLVNGKDVSKAADSSAATISGSTELAQGVDQDVTMSDPNQTTDDPLHSFRQGDTYTKFVVDNVWILLSAMLVFLMHLGFATVESGFMPAKNTVNVIYKNIFILTTGILTYAIVGFRLMYPGEFNILDGILGFPGFGIGFDPSQAAKYLTLEYGMDMTIWSDFLFQAMFAATAATIVSGSVTGRIKMPSYMIYTSLLVAFSYPITGSWKWGGGWLDQLGFHDFAGSTLVHAVGGSLAAMSAATFLMHKMDLGMALNGILGGLVGITAGADLVNPGNAIVIGALSGGIVVGSIMLLEKWGIDDPVSAISVHGVCGIWGTVAVGVFAPGMDAYYHGHTAYPDFMGKN